MSPVAVVAEEGPAIGAPVVGSTGAAPANTDEGGGGAAELPFPSAISFVLLLKRGILIFDTDIALCNQLLKLPQSLSY